MIELKILIGLNRAVNKINRKTAYLCKTHGLTLSQFGILEALYHKGELSIGQAKNLILSSDGTMPVVIKNLEKNDLITKDTHPEDRRSHILKLTEKGRLLIRTVYPKNEELIVGELSMLEREEKELLLTLLKRVSEEEPKQV